MAGNQLAPAEFPSQEQHASAPSSADFYLEEDLPRGFPMWEIRGKRFTREKSSQLVNLESYQPYLLDKPESLPLVLPFNNQGKYVYQHIYFPEFAYRQEGVPPGEKNLLLNWMRRVSYNQIIMRREQEKQLHKDFEQMVTPPSSEVMRKNLEDFAHLDIIGASALGKVVAMHPEVQAIVLSRAGGLPPAVAEITPTERVDHFDNLLKSSVDKLGDPLITPNIVISGALKRIAQLVGDRELESEADTRLVDEDTYYPLRLPKLERLYWLSNHLITTEGSPVDIAQPKDLVDSLALQTGVDDVELQAA